MNESRSGQKLHCLLIVAATVILSRLIFYVHGGPLFTHSPTGEQRQTFWNNVNTQFGNIEYESLTYKDTGLFIVLKEKKIHIAGVITETKELL